MSEYVYAGLTSQTIDIFIRDSSSTTGQGLSGLAFNSGSLVASYRKGATGSRTAITLAAQTVGGAFSSGGFVEIDATNMKGVYRLDLPNAAVDTEGFVTVFLSGAANMVPVALRIDCRPLPADVKKIGSDAQSATDLKDFVDAGYDPSTNKVNAELDSSSLAAVNAQVVDALSVDTYAELSSPPAATSSLKDKITWLFMHARNKVTQTALAKTLYRDDTTTVAGTSATSDNGTTFTKGEDT